MTRALMKRGYLDRFDTRRLPCEDKGRNKVMCLQAEGCLIASKPPEARTEAWNSFLSQPLEENNLANDLI